MLFNFYKFNLALTYSLFANYIFVLFICSRWVSENLLTANLYLRNHLCGKWIGTLFWVFILLPRIRKLHIWWEILANCIMIGSWLIWGRFHLSVNLFKSIILYFWARSVVLVIFWPNQRRKCSFSPYCLILNAHSLPPLWTV